LITVKLFGGAKKSFSTDRIVLEKRTDTINELITHLVEIKPKNTLEFDTKNLLIAVNGVDSSALKGYDTRLSDNDEISIIPIIHGGSRRIQFSIGQSNVEIFDILFDQKIHRDFLDELRISHKQLVIQAINPKFLLNAQHAKKILAISLHAKKTNTMLSKKIETDILLRFAVTTQISEAIKSAGRKMSMDFLIIAIGKKSSLSRLYSELKPSLNQKPLSRNNKPFLKKQFNISKNQLSAAQSKDSLEDVIVEKAAVLV
jgi:molybdopterin converting factor small subunit/tRNA threonylcarbamoyladenosine modification (KEOPS) complex Cgi121 subunit